MAPKTTTTEGTSRQAVFPTPTVDRGEMTRLADAVTIADGDRDIAEIHAPMTGELIGTHLIGTPEDVAFAVDLAYSAQRAWASLTYQQRAKIFLRFHDLILDRRNQILDIIQLETGKARAHAFEEVADAAIVSRYYAFHGWDAIKPRRRQGALPLLTKTQELRHPKGVVGIIAPWNYPLSMGITDAIPALLAGNGVVIKPDSQTPFTLLWAVAALRECGLPSDILHAVPGPGRVLGDPLIDAVDYIAFTGSTTTGRKVAQRAAANLIGCSLELGGKNALVVLDDADVDKAVDGAIRATYANAGQLCISIERIFVHESLRDRFVTAFVELASALRMEPGFDWNVQMGCLISESQLATVEHHIADARAKGATVLAGGSARPDLGPLYHEPTVLAGVTPDMDVFSEETFGPVVSIYGFTSDDEALALVNASRYGLNTSVWGRDTGRARAFASRVQAGTANVNEGYAAAWASVDSPMGGFKDSGLGRRHGREGITRFTEPQTIALERLLPVAAPPFMSEETYAKVMSGALKVMRRVPGLR